jgi:voltage-gated potassium channel
MLIVAIVFLVAIALPEVIELPDELTAALDGLTWLIWALFAFELVAKTYLAPDRKHYLVTHWLEVLTVLVPFLRPLRLLRVVVVGLRFWAEARTVLRQQTFGLIGVASILAVASTASMVYLAECGGDGPIQTFSDALWRAAATVTTVGYGDMYPKTAAGRGAALLLMICGVSMFGLLTARIAAFFVESKEEPATKRLDAIDARLERIEGMLNASVDVNPRERVN